LAAAQESAAPEAETNAFSELFPSEVIQLSVGDRPAFIVQPTQIATSGEKPWVWYAPALADESGKWELPTARHAKVIRPLLDAGFSFCGVDVGESYGSPRGRMIFSEFYDLLVTKYQLDAKACLFPVSRGGLMHYNWAAEHPDRVLCIGAIYPVCNIEAYPRVERLSAAYGIPAARVRDDLDQHNPLESLKPLAQEHVPIFHIHGDSDEVVPLELHSAALQRKYEALGGKMELLIIPGKGHEFAPEYWDNPKLARFFLDQAEQAAKASGSE
jgi:pimeloyl-ACP methyl ester carboxylesterase